MKRFVAIALIHGLWLAGVAGGCGTDAVGVDACRSIERARCAAAAACELSESESQCNQFVDSNCLHGVALGSSPSQVDVDDCADAIRTAGECADENGTGSDPCECSALSPSGTARTVCDIVREPQRARECRFLIGDPDAGSAPNQCPEASDDDDGPDASLEPNAAGDAG